LIADPHVLHIVSNRALLRAGRLFRRQGGRGWTDPGRWLIMVGRATMKNLNGPLLFLICTLTILPAFRDAETSGLGGPYRERMEVGRALI
jgi:hypothetical protein